MSALRRWFDRLIHGVREPGICERCGKWTEDAKLIGRLVDIDMRTGKQTYKRGQNGSGVSIHVCQQCYENNKWYYRTICM